MEADKPDFTVKEDPSPICTCSCPLHPSEKVEGKLDIVLEELKTVKTQIGNQQKILEKLQSIQDQLDGLKPEKTTIDEPKPQVTGEMDIDEEKKETLDPSILKRFTLWHIFENIRNLKENRPITSHKEEHFGAKWFIDIRPDNDGVGCYLCCEGPETKNNWSIDSEFEIKAIGPDHRVHFKIASYCYTETTGYGWGTFLKLEDLVEKYVINGSLKMEINVNIKKSSGICKQNLRMFDRPMPEVSDVVLIVNNEKFYVTKAYLATHSPYFKSMFFGRFGESTKREITLTGIDGADFQNFLEVIYVESSIDESTVEGILLVADLYDTPLVTRKCEDFLLEKSTKTLKKKLFVSVRYCLERLKKMCLAEIKSIEILRSFTPLDVDYLDPPLLADLLKKSLSFH